MRARPVPIVIALFVLPGCAASVGDDPHAGAAIASAAARSGPLIRFVDSDRARYAPGEPATITVALHNGTGAPYTGHVDLFLRDRGRDVVPSQSQPVTTLQPGADTTVTYRFQPPAVDYRGYLVEAWAWSSDGKVIDGAAGAVDVSSDWRVFPRYGWVSKFEAGTDVQGLVTTLNRYHIDGLQFYDVNWQHDRPYSPNASWPNLANRIIDRGVVRALIDAAHAHNMVAMNYNLWYGAFDNYWNDGSGVALAWGLFTSNCAPSCTPAKQDFTGPFPSNWASDKLYLFDPGNPQWKNYLFAQEKQLFDALPYDGWQIDTLGDPGTRWDFGGHARTIGDELVPFTNEAKAALGSRRVVLNTVGRWHQDDVAAHADVDFVYSELWGESAHYADINAAARAVKAHGSKAVVFPAYMNTGYAAKHYGCTNCFFSDASIRLVNATMLAAGGIHLELGDFGAMASNIYWPGPMLQMTPALQDAEIDLSSFAVGYENLLRYGVADAPNAVAVGGVPTSSDGRAGTVWIVPKTKTGFQIVHLINLTANPSNEWRDVDANYPQPAPRTDLPVKLYYSGAIHPGVSRLMYATPDYDHGKSYELAYTAGSDGGGNFVSFTLPRLWYWDLIYLETDTLAGSGYDVDARGLIEAEHFTRAGGGDIGVADCNDATGGLLVGNACCGRWVAYEGVQFGAGVASVSLRIASATGGDVELHVDAPDGPRVASGSIAATGGWQLFRDVTLPVSGASGRHDLYVVFPGQAVNLNYFRFQ